MTESHALPGVDGQLGGDPARYPQTAHDWVRPGIVLYGASPFADARAEASGLKPVMTLSSKILAVQDVPVGRARRLRWNLRAATRPTRRHRRLRLRRWLSAPCAERYADPRCRQAHDDRGPCIDGHAGLRSDGHPGSRRR